MTFEEIEETTSTEEVVATPEVETVTEGEEEVAA